MRPAKFDKIKNKPFDGQVSDTWTKQYAYSVIFTDGTKGTIRTSKTREQLLASGRYSEVIAVKPAPVNQT